MKHVLIINGHPDKESFNYALSEAYKKGVNKTDSILSQINIAELEFNPNLQFGYRKRTALEPDLVDAIDKIKQADHIVWVFPVWWYSYPALMKGFIDRTFLPGITYQLIDGKPFPEKLLKGKSARLIITADTPKWYDFLIMKRPAINQFKKGTLQFCGINPVKVTYISTIKSSSSVFRKKWLEKIALLGESIQ
ncbi:NAD(P)H-dependent oxidoreductase [Tamlana sp. 2_MG-2023]|uniref:NAD(P)H-dependent oxidoreductase n=1 Tax=unclassified Tamlana TaxID=2614803 RepID=UPI0026E2ECF5|nr:MULTISPECIES: NAD(P)H-dependent oxidoreductase [unclassified Tamlana]MDO6758720.1 NAD(P)H-dependent oxidoreductase [Tamlana sp. 2_MG-2023]MDO6789419.1 NAD(P)H-dependent oxidoreductase [Tamlana sp. 1_MG-2023]